MEVRPRRISIHTPAKGVTSGLLAVLEIKQNFNPHSREGSDVIISPTQKIPCNFNPHSQEGSDVTYQRLRFTVINFNPHSQEGSDWWEDGAGADEWISIHTPKKGVTICSWFRLLLFNGFQSTLPRREWLLRFPFSLHLQIFQSTLPRREWHVPYIAPAVKSYFNPHSQEGSDLSFLYVSTSFFYFNPHSQEGSDDQINHKIELVTTISIHTPKKGVTTMYVFAPDPLSNFNPHSQEGSDKTIVLFFLSINQFQSTLPRREWRTWPTAKQRYAIDFNPHSQEGSDFSQSFSSS